MAEVSTKSIVFEYRTEAKKMRYTPPRITHRPQFYIHYDDMRKLTAEPTMLMIVKIEWKKYFFKIEVRSFF